MRRWSRRSRKKIACRCTASYPMIAPRAWRHSSRSGPRTSAATKTQIAFSQRRLDEFVAEDLLANIEVTPREVSKRIERADKFLFVDVREQWEHETSHIEGS